MAKNYNTRTASLKATIADIRNLDAKQIKLNGNPIVGNVYDLREGNISEYDIWPNGVKTDENGNVTVYPLGYNKLSVEEYENIKNKFIVDGSVPQDSTLYLVRSIKNNKVLDADGNILFYFDTNALENTRDENSTTRVSIPFHYLESFESDLDNLVDGSHLFLVKRYMKSFKPNNLNKLKTATSMFQLKNSNPPDDGYGLVDFDIDLPELEIGNQMFQYHTTLKTFKSNTPSLINAKSMFEGCYALTTFNSDLSNLIVGNNMFARCTNLPSFTTNLPSLLTGYNMFSGCNSLTSFSGDLSSLVNGSYMFSGTSLTYFSGDLSGLVNGSNMFYKTHLNPRSVMAIVESIKNLIEEKAKYESGEIPWVTYDSTTKEYSAPFGFMEDGSYVFTYNLANTFNIITTTTYPISSSGVGILTLGIDVTNNAETINDQLQTFAEECFCDSWAELKQKFVDKGWTVTFQYGGTDSSITLSEDEQFRGVPVYARLIEVSEEDKDKAEYCTEDGTKFYNIDWGHDVTDYDQYQYFGSLLEACGYYGVIPKKYLEV